MRKYVIPYARTDRFGIDSSRKQIKLLMEYVQLHQLELIEFRIEDYRDENGVRDELPHLDKALSFCLQADKPEEGVEFKIMYVDMGKVLRSSAFTRRIKKFQKNGGKVLLVEPGSILDDYVSIRDEQSQRKHSRHTPIVEKIDDESRRLKYKIDKRQWRNFLHLRQDNIDILLNACLGEPSTWRAKKEKEGYIFKTESLASTAQFLNAHEKKTVSNRPWTKENVRKAWNIVQSPKYRKFFDLDH